MRQHIRRKQYDAEALHGSGIPSSFGQAAHVGPEDTFHPLESLIQTKLKSPAIGLQTLRRVDQIPSFPTRNAPSVQRHKDETSGPSQTSPVQQLIIQRLREQDRHPLPSRKGEDNNGYPSSLGFKQAIARQSNAHSTPHASQAGVQRRVEASSSPKPMHHAPRESSPPSIQTHSMPQPSKAHDLKAMAHTGKLTLQAKDFSGGSALGEYQRQSNEGYPLQLKAIAQASENPKTIIQRDKKNEGQDPVEESKSSSMAPDDVPTFTRESSLSSVDGGNNISFAPVAVDLDDGQDETDSYSRSSSASLSRDAQSTDNPVDMTTLSNTQLNSHLNATTASGQNSNSGTSGLKMVGQGQNPQLAPKDSLWQRFKKKMKGEKANAARNVPLAAAQAFNITEGVSILNRLDSASDQINVMADGSWMGVTMSQVLDTVLSTTWCSLCLGGNIIKAFHYQRRRKNGYKKAWDATGFKEDKKGNVLAPLPEAAHQNQIKLGRIAKYAYHKANRGFLNTLVKCVLQITRLISYLITALSGGAAAIVTGAIALSTKIAEATMALSRKAKGIWKLFKGTKGKNRQHNARELLVLAKDGDAQAAQTIMDVNPFSELLSKAENWTLNATKKRFIMGRAKNSRRGHNNWKNLDLPRPRDANDLSQQLQSDGLYSDKVRNDPEGKKRRDRLEAMLERPETNEKLKQQLGLKTIVGEYLVNEAAGGLQERAQAIVDVWDAKGWSTSDISMSKPTGWKHLFNELQPGGLYCETDPLAPKRKQKLQMALSRTMLSQ